MRGLLILLTLLVLAANAQALDIETYKTTFNLIDDKAVVETYIEIKNTTGILDITIPADNTALSVYVDDKLISIGPEDNILKINLSNASKIHLNYVTQEVIDKTNFLMNMKADYNISDLEIKLVLPSGAMLKRPIKKGTGSIFPKPTETDTDGRSLIFIWKQKDVKQGDEIAIFAQIEPKKDYSTWIAVIIILIILIILGFFAYQKRPKKNIQQEAIEKHLKEDEEQIITVLKNKERSCEQGTLRVITGFSKAHLSRLLKELEERKVIYKEKRGKKNIVFLK